MHFNFSKKFLISLSAFILSISIIILTRTVPVSQLWKGFKLVYVKSEKLTDENILDVLEKNHCKNVVCISDQSIPVYSKIAPVQVQEKDSWLYARTKFFTDSTSSFRIFYVPENQKNQIEKAVDELNCYSDTTAGVDGASSFPWISPFLAVIFYAVLCYFSKKRILFSAASLPLLIFAFCRPLYTCCAAVFLLLLAEFLLQNIYGRRGFLNDLKNGLYVIPLFFIPVFLLVFSSFFSSVLFIVAAVSSICLVVVYDEIQKMICAKNNSLGISFVLIKKSSSVRIFNGKNALIAGGASIFTILLLLCSIAFAGISGQTGSEERPLLPSPVSNIKNPENALPDMDDFMSWSFSSVSLPYRKLGGEKQFFQKGDSVYFEDYSLNSQGSIEVEQKKVLTWDSSFESSIYDTVNGLKYPALEKMLLRQGKNSKYAYTKNTGSTSEKAVTFILLFFAAVPVILCLYWLTGKFRNDFSL